jgi:hypothetical protein
VLFADRMRRTHSINEGKTIRNKAKIHLVSKRMDPLESADALYSIGKTQKSSSTAALRERLPACNALGGWYNGRALQAPAGSITRPEWMMILQMSSGIGPVSGRAMAGDSPSGWPLQIVRADLSLLLGALFG